MQRSATEAVEARVSAAAEAQRAMLRLHDEVAYREGLKWQERMATLEQVEGRGGGEGGREGEGRGGEGRGGEGRGGAGQCVEGLGVIVG